jgi:hypothetical protein
MSTVEINIGVLVPTKLDDDSVITYMWDCIPKVKTQFDNLWHFEEEYEDFLEEANLRKFNGVWYKITNRERYAEDGDICNLTKNPDGTISFFTQHYNGGGEWHDEIENNLK